MPDYGYQPKHAGGYFRGYLDCDWCEDAYQPRHASGLVRVVFTRDTRNLATYPADIRVIPL